MFFFRKERRKKSEREKEIVKKLAETVPNLDKEKQNYILGVAEGMAIARETDKTEINSDASE